MLNKQDFITNIDIPGVVDVVGINDASPVVVYNRIIQL